MQLSFSPSYTNSHPYGPYTRVVYIVLILRAHLGTDGILQRAGRGINTRQLCDHLRAAGRDGGLGPHPNDREQDITRVRDVGDAVLL